MLIALSCVSSMGLLIVTDTTAQNILCVRSWKDDESSQLSQQLRPQFESALTELKIETKRIQGLWCASGPGAFTGLRVSASFFLGLARALSIPLRTLPSFDLVGEPFFIPLQHQKVKTMHIGEALNTGVEFLHIESREKATIQRPQSNDRVLGVLPDALWPTPLMLFQALQKNLRSEGRFAINYGLNPKISGQRI